MSDYNFTCPHCNQNLEAPPETLGQTVECPACQGQIKLFKPTAQQQVVRVVVPTPPPMSTVSQIPHTCPLCGNSKYMNDARMLYGQLVCRKCYYSFANRRQLAYFLDLLVYYGILLIAGVIVGGVMGASGSSESAIQGAASLLGWILLPVLICKDCFSGQSAGKAMCGVKVIDQTTGEPGGIGSSFKRNLPLVIPFVPLIIAFQLCKGHRTGDGWSNTKVIWKKYATNPIFAPFSP